MESGKGSAQEGKPSALGGDRHPPEELTLHENRRVKMALRLAKLPDDDKDA